MKHKNIVSAVVLGLCAVSLFGCSRVSDAVDKGESIVKDVESSLFHDESSGGLLLEDSDWTDSNRMDSNRMDSDYDESSVNQNQHR